MLAWCFGKSRTESQMSLTEDFDTKPVAETDISHPQEALSVCLIGTLDAKAVRFTIDFLPANSKKNDVILRIVVSAKRNLVSRNTRRNGSWGNDETLSLIPYKIEPGKNIKVQVLFTVAGYMIAVNGFHVGKYEHRMPFRDVRKVEVRGHIKNACLEKRMVTEYPTRPEESEHIENIMEPNAQEAMDYAGASSCSLNQDGESGRQQLPLPYYAIFCKGDLGPNQSVMIDGRVKGHPHRILIVMQTGIHVWPLPLVPVKLVFSFSDAKDGETGDPEINISSYLDGSWMEPKKCLMPTGLRGGAHFNLRIVSGKRGYEIIVNDHLITQYPYHIQPHHIDTVFVTGDIELYTVGIV